MSKLRQKLRAACEAKLNELVLETRTVVMNTAEVYGMEFDDFCRVVAGRHAQTAKNACITQMANLAEADLIKLYNNQQALTLEGKPAKEKTQ